MSDWKKLEAALFASGRYLSEKQLEDLTGLSKKKLKAALDELRKHYDAEDTSLNLFEEDGTYKLNVKEDYSSIIKNVVSEAEMPLYIMETLAVIAYKTPVLQSEVINIRGQGAYDHIKYLEEKKFVIKEKFGRTYKLKVADKFYDYFEIDNSAKIGEVFKDVKKPATLGDLSVYDSNSDDSDFQQKVTERLKKIEVTDEDEQEKENFLGDFEERLEKTKTRIDEAEKDIPKPGEKEEESDDEALDDTEKMLRQVEQEIEEITTPEDKEEK